MSRPRRKSNPSRAGRKQAGSSSRLWIAAGVAVVAIVAFFVYGALMDEAYRQRVANADLSDVEQFPSEGREHVPEGTRIAYRTDPPTSGPHYDKVAEPRFYEQPVNPGYLVHNLEHGHVIIYYDPERTPEAALDYVRTLTRRYRGVWDAVLAVPRSLENEVLILTAWQHMLRLETFDPAKVDAFVDAYRGRGPENPVR